MDKPNPIDDTVLSPDGDSSLVAVATKTFPIANWERYEFIRLLGQGGMGAVYLARDPRLGRLIALKFIRNIDAHTTLRFMQEARAQARIDHPDICKIYEVGEISGRAYIAMQFIDGLSLEQAAKQMSLLDKVQAIKDAASALHAAHQRGIIHRDIKPANIMVERVQDSASAVSYRPVVMDFGLAREVNDTQGLTESGMMLGTPAYMPPEQARGQTTRMDRRSDVYSLGATLYELLTGTPPFVAEGLVYMLMQILEHPPPRLRLALPAAPEALEIIVEKCLRKDPDSRYQSAKDLADDLDRFLRGEPILAKKLSVFSRLRYRARRNKLATVLLVSLLVSLLGLGGFSLRVHAQNLRKVRQQSALAQKLGQHVERIEWQMRAAYFSPLHDITQEKEAVRARLSEIDREMRGYGDIGVGLGHYVLGRGHLALHDFDKAEEHLQQAEEAGVRDPELDYALGRVLGEKYRKAIEEARRGGDRSFFARRKAELDQELLAPSLGYLQKSHARTKVSANYMQGLIDFYSHRFDAALLNAYFAQQQTPWFYEAIQLEGDVHTALALEQMAHGDYSKSEENFQTAIKRYERAAEFGRSDHRLYESIAKVWNMLMVLDRTRFLSPQQRLGHALLAAEQSISAAPHESLGPMYISQAHHTVAQYLQAADRKERLPAIEKAIAAGARAVLVRPNNPEAYRGLANGYILNAKYIARYEPEQSARFETSVQNAHEYLKKASLLNSKDPSVFSSIAHVYQMQASYSLDLGKDPKEDILLSIQSIRRAIELDAEQADFYTQLSVNYWLWSQFNSEYGRNSEDLVRASAEVAATSMKINPNGVLDRSYLGLIYCSQGKYCLDARCDVEGLTDKAIKLFQDAIAASQKRSHRPYLFSALAYEIRARDALRLERDPAPAIADGLAAAQACERLAPEEAYCHTHRASLLTTEGEWRSAHGKNPLPSFYAALDSARRAVQLSGRQQEADARMAVGRVSRQLALFQLARARNHAVGSGLSAIIDEGLNSLDRALQVRRGRPRALALQGALLLLHARTSGNAAERSAAVQKARKALALAIVENPLLKLPYESLLVESETIATGK